MVRCRITAKRIGTIKDINKREDLTLLTDSQDVESVKEYFGNRKAVDEFDGFFVKVGEGDYDEIYGFEGSVPYLSKSLYKISMNCR